MTKAGQLAFRREEIELLSRVLGRRQVASMAGASERELADHAKAGHGLSDSVIYRLHFLVGLVAALKATYTEVAIRRWFERPRQRFGGRSPDKVLK